MRPFSEFISILKSSTNLTRLPHSDIWETSDNSLGCVLYIKDSEKLIFTLPVREDEGHGTTLTYDYGMNWLVYSYTPYGSPTIKTHFKKIDLVPNDYVSTEEVRMLLMIYEDISMNAIVDILKG